MLLIDLVIRSILASYDIKMYLLIKYHTYVFYVFIGTCKVGSIFFHLKVSTKGECNFIHLSVTITRE